MNKHDLTSSQIYEQACGRFKFWRGMKIAAFIWMTIATLTWLATAIPNLITPFIGKV